MLRFISISFFLNDLIIMRFVLPKLIDNLLISHHFLTLTCSEFINKCSSAFRSFAKANILVSSAKILKHSFSEQFGKSISCLLEGLSQQFCNWL